MQDFSVLSSTPSPSSGNAVARWHVNVKLMNCHRRGIGRNDSLPAPSKQLVEALSRNPNSEALDMAGGGRRAACRTGYRPCPVLMYLLRQTCRRGLRSTTTP